VIKWVTEIVDSQEDYCCFTIIIVILILSVIKKMYNKIYKINNMGYSITAWSCCFRMHPSNMSEPHYLTNVQDKNNYLNSLKYHTFSFFSTNKL
jgi:hypothetical protein